MFVHGLALSRHESATTAYAVMVVFVLWSLWLCQSVLWHGSLHHTLSVVCLATAALLKGTSLCPRHSLIRPLSAAVMKLMPWVPHLPSATG